MKRRTMVLVCLFGILASAVVAVEAIDLDAYPLTTVCELGTATT